MNNVLDLTDQTISEDGLLFNLQKAFDAGEQIVGVRVNSEGAKNLHGSPALIYSDQGIWEFHSPFGIVEIIPVSKQELDKSTNE